MRLKLILAILFAFALTLQINTDAQAYGVAHVGYTHAGPNGVQHYGATAASGPNGVSPSGSHATATNGQGGAVHESSRSAVYGGGGAYHYTAGESSAYHVGGGGTGAVHTEYKAGVYRAP